MKFIIALAVIGALVFFVAIPLIKGIFKALLELAGQLLGILIGIGLLVLTVWLCILFPPLLIPIGIFAVYSIIKDRKGDPNRSGVRTNQRANQ
ncbi:hypothetical protein [Vreelandella piezotolerans]|uniref:hypothetical protein n=1 Tax=Vreelandella piezotolerans TaxID=2609667 RepID=UPI001C630809|nr:hypothetical protein [Halomonas piezotolerans]